MNYKLDEFAIDGKEFFSISKKSFSVFVILGMVLSVVPFVLFPLAANAVSTPTFTISPNQGPTTGGTSITLTGTHLENATSVTIDGHAITLLTNINTQITGTTPAGTVGAKDVVVHTAHGDGTLTHGFTYIVPVTHIITASTASNGSISPSGSVSVNDGANQSFTFTPDSGYHVDKVTVDGDDSVPTTSPYTFTNVTANHAISVTFAADSASITVHKKVVAPNGDEESDQVTDNTQFTVSLNNIDTDETSTDETLSETHNVTYSDLTPGQHYTITESQNDNYGSIIYSSDCDIASLNPGQTAECTITNVQKQATLTVRKIVDNSHDVGKDNVASDFSFQVNGGDAIQFPAGDDASQSEKTIPVNPGTYTITEVDSKGYAVETSENADQKCTDIVVGSNGTAICTITNHDLEEGKAAITVVKNVINDNGGTATAGDFQLYITEQNEGCEGDCVVPPMQVFSGDANQLNPGTYTISEIIPETNDLNEKYAPKGISCTVNGDAVEGSTVTISEGDVAVCTVTNDDQPAHLTIVKNTTNESYNGTFAFTVTGHDNQSITTANGTGSVTMELNRGGYDVQEIVPQEWNLSGVSCHYDTQSIGDGIPNGEHIFIENGHEVTCTFTDSPKLGTLIVKKTIVNDNGGDKTFSDFSFQVNGGEATQFNSEDGQNEMTVVAGTYTITEVPSDNYVTSYNNCSDVVVSEDSTTTCEITNTFSNLVISDERAVNVQRHSITIKWTTNHPATSRVVYGTDPVTTLGSTPNYGYPNSTVEDSTLTTDHTVVISGLDEGTTYYFRPVSHGSPEVVGDEISAKTESGGGSSGGFIGGGAQFTITASTVGLGFISPVGSSTIGVGNTTTYSITPDAGAQIADVLVDGASVGPVSTYTFADISADHTIVAQFAPAGQVLGASTTNEGGTTPPPSNPGLNNPTGTNPSIGSAASTTGGQDQTTEGNTNANIDTEATNSAQAAVGGATGNAFWIWVTHNWQFLLIILIAAGATYYIYWMRSNNKV